MEKLKNIATRLQASLGLLPAVMSGLAIAFAWLLLFADTGLSGFGDGDSWWLFSGDAETARKLLSSLLSGMITMASLVVSITMVVLSLAAGQLGPRLIGNFLRDRQIQAVLGLFMGTILYTLFVLRSVHGELGADAVPHIAISAASVLSMLCLFSLLFYVQKIARSIIADTVVTEVANELERAISHVEGETDGRVQERELQEYRWREWISLGKSGYVQVIDHGRLVKLAIKESMMFRLHCRAGQFLLREGDHIEVFSDAPPRDDLADEVASAFVIGSDRTPTQDLEYSIRQLVEIAVRAMSTGINDPFTALSVVNRLGAALESANRAPAPKARYLDGDGRLRVLAEPHDFAGLLDASFNQIRQAAASNAAVLIQMSQVIGQLAFVVDRTERREALLAHLDKLDRAARKNLGDPADIEDFAAVAEAARGRLVGSRSPEKPVSESGD